MRPPTSVTTRPKALGSSWRSRLFINWLISASLGVSGSALAAQAPAQASDPAIEVQPTHRSSDDAVEEQAPSIEVLERHASAGELVKIDSPDRETPGIQESLPIATARSLGRGVLTRASMITVISLSTPMATIGIALTMIDMEAVGLPLVAVAAPGLITAIIVLHRSKAKYALLADQVKRGRQGVGHLTTSSFNRLRRYHRIRGTGLALVLVGSTFATVGAVALFEPVLGLPILLSGGAVVAGGAVLMAHGKKRARAFRRELSPLAVRGSFPVVLPQKGGLRLSWSMRF